MIINQEETKIIGACLEEVCRRLKLHDVGSTAIEMDEEHGDYTVIIISTSVLNRIYKKVRGLKELFSGE